MLYMQPVISKELPELLCRELAFDMDCLLPFLVVGSSSSALSPGLERWMSMGLSKLNIIECIRCSFSFWATSSEQRLEHLSVSASAAVHAVRVASYQARSFSRHALH